MDEFTPWTLFTDVGIISLLLLLGKLIRVKIEIAQRYFIPPSLMAGFMGLAFGPGGLGWLPLSNNMGTYASILIAFIFGCLPFASETNSTKRGSRVKRMWIYSQTGMLLQWAFGALAGISILSVFWPVAPYFGLSLPSGFCGGHGTAAAIGQAFNKMGGDDMMTLAMTCATIGILCSVFIGLALIKWGTKKGNTTFLTTFDDLPHELRTGLLPTDKRRSMGESSTSPISIDSLAFNLSIIAMVALGGYTISKGVSYFMPQLEMPVFSCAFVFGILMHFALKKTGALHYTSPRIIGHLSGAFTDFLIAFGISSIKLSVVMNYIIPLSILVVFGLLFTLLYVLLVGKWLMKDDCWFEKALFTWGWFTGTVAMGIAMLRVADPEQKSHCMEDYAIAYLFIAPVEICLITFAPVAFANGYGLHFGILALITGVCIITYAWIKKQ